MKLMRYSRKNEKSLQARLGVLVGKDLVADLRAAYARYLMNLRIRTRVNGELRQDGNTSEMIHAIPKLVSYLSQMTLMPGDVISTGKVYRVW